MGKNPGVTGTPWAPLTSESLQLTADWAVNWDPLSASVLHSCVHFVCTHSNLHLVIFEIIINPVNFRKCLKLWKII
jgi:hypothetical protein